MQVCIAGNHYTLSSVVGAGFTLKSNQMAIIALSGYARSGKDTVATIIQYLLAHSEPSYPLHMAIDKPHYTQYLHAYSNWERKAFAHKLKEVLSLLTGISTHELLYNQSIKDVTLPREWDVLAEDEYLRPITVREALQKIGTDALRDNFHSEVWVNALLSDYDGDSQWVITDLRFKNEATALERIKDAFLVRVNRPGVGPANNHPSEVDLDDYPFSYSIDNYGDTAQLILEVMSLLKKLQLL